MPVRRKNQIARNDKLWGSIIVKRDDNICQHCGRYGEHPHHVFYRRKMGARWLPENGVTLCDDCHVPFAHARPELFMSWWRDFVGEEVYLIVFDASMKIKLDLDEEERKLKNIFKIIA